METIATFGEPIEAHLAKARLEAAGIPAFIADENSVGVAWHLTVALGGVKLQVADENADEARSVLADRTPAAAVETEDESPIEASDAAAVGKEDDEQPLTAREQLADRSLRGAVVSFFFPPLALYVWWLLIQVFTSEEGLSARYRRRAVIATLINVPMVLAAIWLIRIWVGV
jgi:hypothetical protein